MEQLLAQHDWGATELGAADAWSPRLKGAVDLMMAWPAPAVLLGGREGLTMFNEAYAQLAVPVHPPRLGASAAESPGDLGAPLLRKVLGGQSVSYRDRRFLPETGDPVVLDLDYAPIYDEAGCPIAAFGVITQTGARRLPDPLITPDEMMALLAHELRTPMATVTLWSKMLRAGLVAPADQARALAAIEEAASAQERLLDELLDVWRLATGTLRLDLAEVEPGAVVARALELARAQAEAEGVTLRVLPSEAGAAEAVELVELAALDRERIERVVRSLVHNAITVTGKGGDVTLATGRRAGAFVIEVTDAGQGAAPLFLPQLFDRWRRGTRQTMGGLGLAMARQVIELHGGRIQAQSRGPGATITVELPLRRLANKSHAH